MYIPGPTVSHGGGCCYPSRLVTE